MNLKAPKAAIVKLKNILRPKMEALMEFYTVVYDQQFSPCGSYLVTADNYGRIAVFK